MAVGRILRVSWICLLLFGESLPFPTMKGYNYTSKTDRPNIVGDKDDKLETSPTVMLNARGYADRSYKVLLAAAPKQPLLTPKEGARNQGGGAVEFGQEIAKMEDWELAKPVTFPLNPPSQHDYVLDSRKPQFPSADVSYKPLIKWSLNPGRSFYPNTEFFSDLIPPTAYQWMEADASSSGPTLEAQQVSRSSMDFDPSQNLNFQVGEQDGSQSFSSRVNDFGFTSAEYAYHPSKEGDRSNYDSVNAVQPSTWASDSYITRGEELVFSSNSGNWAQATPTSNGAKTLEADAVSSSDTKGGYSSSSLNLNFQAAVQDDSQSYSPNLVYEDIYKYPSAETAQLPSKEGDPSNYDSVNAVQPSTWSSAPYMTRGEDPVFSSNSGNWAQAAPTSNSEQTLKADAVSSSDTKGGYSSSSLNLNFQAAVQDDSQSYSPNLVYEDVYKYPSAETAQLPSKEGDPSNYDSVNAVQPSTWSSAPYMTRGEDPVFSSNSGNWAQAAPTSNSAQTLKADAVSSSDTKGGYSSSSLNLNFQVAVQDDSQSYSPNLVYEDIYKYPSAETAQLPSKEGDPSNYDSVNAVQPSTWPSAPYMTRGEDPVFSSNSGNWAQAAPVEAPAYVAGSTLDSTSSKAAAQPVHFQPVKKGPPQLPSTQRFQRPQEVSKLLPSTYIVQSKGGYRRGRKVYTKTKYFRGFHPPPPFVRKLLRPESETLMVEG